jgi:hypothetical protein
MYFSPETKYLPMKIATFTNISLKIKGEIKTFHDNID